MKPVQKTARTCILFALLLVAACGRTTPEKPSTQPGVFNAQPAAHWIVELGHADRERKKDAIVALAVIYPELKEDIQKEIIGLLVERLWRDAVDWPVRDLSLVALGVIGEETIPPLRSLANKSADRVWQLAVENWVATAKKFNERAKTTVTDVDIVRAKRLSILTEERSNHDKLIAEQIARNIVSTKEAAEREAQRKAWELAQQTFRAKFKGILRYAHPTAHALNDFEGAKPGGYDGVVPREVGQRSDGGRTIAWLISYWDAGRTKIYELTVLVSYSKSYDFEGMEWGNDTGPVPPGLVTESVKLAVREWLKR